MSTRMGNDTMRTSPIGVVALPGLITFGANGAPTLTKARGAWTVALTATGRYTVTFTDKHAEMVGAPAVMFGSASAGTMGEHNLEEHTAYSSSAGTWVFSVGVGSGEAEPASGVTLRLTFFMKYNNIGG